MHPAGLGARLVTRLGSPQDLAGGVEQRGAARKARRGLDRQCGAKERVDLWRQAAAHRARRRRQHPAEALRQRGQRVVAVRSNRLTVGAQRPPVVISEPGPAQREHLVEDQPEGVAIRATIDVDGDDLLWGHVRQGAHRAPLGGLVDGHPVEDLGQTEVEDLHRAAGDHDVARLQVPVQHPLGVGVIHRGAELGEHREHLDKREVVVYRAAQTQLVLEAGAGDQLHHEVRLNPGELHVDHRRDVLMTEGAEDVRFPGEALPGHLVGAVHRVKQLHRDDRVVGPVSGRPDRRRAAATDRLVEDEAVTDDRASAGGGVLHQRATRAARSGSGRCPGAAGPGAPARSRRRPRGRSTRAVAVLGGSPR